MNPSYISKNLTELLDNAPDYVLDLIEKGEVNNTTAILGKVYKLPVGSYVALSNIISYILIGALKPENVVQAIVDMLHLPQDDALRLAQDLDKSILEKARIKILGKAPTDMVELTFQEGRSTEDLRKEILDTTKRESGLAKEQSSYPKETLPIQPQPAAVPPTAPSSPAVAASETVPATADAVNSKGISAAPGSRSMLMEQLQILGDIPNDDEVAERLAKIQAQIASMGEKGGESELSSSVPLQNYILGDKAGETVQAETKLATYSKAPTKYNVDPYREQVEE